jgi:hypothetical protein
MTSQPRKHCVFICLCLKVLDNLNVFSIMTYLLLSLRVLYHSTVEDKKRLASINTFCIDTDLESSHPLIPATS